MERVYFDERPKAYEAVGNGSFRYRWDIREERAQGMEEDGQERTVFSSREVIVWPPITCNKITQAVISATWDGDYEQKLVNEYNAAVLGMIGGAKTSEEAKAKIEAYKAFLTERTALKAQVDADCEEIGIE